MDLLEYVQKRRGGKNHRVGLLLGRKISDRVYIGWSKCHMQKDKFSPEFGLLVANERIVLKAEGESRNRVVPNSIHLQLERFVDRCKRYYKTEEVEVA